MSCTREDYYEGHYNGVRCPSGILFYLVVHCAQKVHDFSDTFIIYYSIFKCTVLCQV